MKLKKCIEELGAVISTTLVRKTALLGRDSVGIKEGFRFQIMLVETGLEGGGGDLIKKVANREGEISFEKLNR